MLGDFGSGGCRNQGCSAGDVEGEWTTAAGSNTINQLGALLIGERDRNALLPHHVNKARELGGLFSTCREDGEERRGFHIGHLAGEDLAEDGACLFARELSAIFGERLQQGLQGIHISEYGNCVALRLREQRIQGGRDGT